LVALNNWGDERMIGFCAFCGSGAPTTVDHCPSKVLLNKPFPPDLPVVPACANCNQSFSADEQYLACLIGCILAGTTEPAGVENVGARAALLNSPLLRHRIENGRIETPAGPVFEPEMQRVEAVLLKLAQGHALHELNEPRAYPPSRIWSKPLLLLSDGERDEFENATMTDGAWPELGSRAFQRAALAFGQPASPWVVVQEGQYRFLAEAVGGVSVRIVIRDYLAALVEWVDD
jgi:hypothetical protein